MAIIIEKGALGELARSFNVEVTVKPSFKVGNPGYTEYLENKNSITVIPGKTKEEFITCYQNAIKLAEEKGIKSIIFPLFGADNEQIPIKDAWKAATYAINTAETGVETYLALDTTAKARISRSLPKYEKPQEVSIDLTNMHHDSVPANSFQFVTMAQKNQLDEDLKEATNSETEALAEAFEPYLERAKKTVGDVYYEVIDVMSKSTCYNILQRNRSGRASKRNVVAIALVLGLNLNEVNEVLASGGMALSKTKEDKIYQDAFDFGWTLEDVDEMLKDNDFKTLSEGYM